MKRFCMNKKTEISERDFNRFLNNLPISIFEMKYSYSTKVGKFTYLNNSARNLLLKIISETELNSEFNMLKMLVSPELATDSLQLLDRIQEKGILIINNRQFLLKSKDDKQILVDANLRVKMKGDTVIFTGTFQESSKVIVDETMKSTPEFLEMQKEMSTFHNFFEAFNALILIVNEEGRLLFISPNAADRFLYKPRTETIGKKFDEIFPKGQADFFLAHCLESIEKNELVTIEFHLPVNNKVRWFQSQAFPVQDTNSETKKVLIIIRDVTDLKTKLID